MVSERNVTIWIPLALGTAGVLMGVALTKFSVELPSWASVIGAFIAVALVGWAVYLAYQKNQTDGLRGGAGGRAFASGEDSQAIGGRGGDAGSGDGGDGGMATAKGRRSVARGGGGGKG